MSVRTYLKILVTLTVILYLAVLVLALSNRSEISEVRNAACSFRENLKERVEDSNRFLASHPGGVLGESHSALLITVRNQEHTLKSLEGLSC